MWTLEQASRWDMETKVLVDRALDRGAARVVSEGEAQWCLTDAQRWCAPYFMTAVYTAEQQWTGIDREAYENWVTGLVPNAVLTPEAVEQYARELKHWDCPLLRCERSPMRQYEVPVARPALTYTGRAWDETSITFVDWAPPLTREQVADARRWGKTDWSHIETLRPRGLDAAAKRPVNSGVPEHVAKRNVRLDGRRR